MDDLTYTLRQLCQRNRDGSYTTQADRMHSLSLAARQLREAGFRQMKASSLKDKHVQTLLERWQGEGLSSGTIKESAISSALVGRKNRQVWHLAGGQHAAWRGRAPLFDQRSARPRNWAQILNRSPMLTYA
jgi:hypothetical protein